jgi:hypothetical protein
MAFCKYCGKQLNENEVCDCEQSRANINNTNDYENKNSSNEIKIDLIKLQFKFNINDFATYFINYFKHPISTAQNHIKSKDYTSVLLQSISLILFSILSRSSVLIKYKSFSFLVILFAFIYSILYIFIPSVISLASKKIQKENSDFVEEMMLSVLHTPVYIISLVLVTISGFIGIKEYIVMSILSVLIYVFSMASLTSVKDEYKNNMIFRIIISALIVAGILMFALMFYFECKAVLTNMLDELLYDLMRFSY